jgi:hypothetical protein
MQGRKEGDSWYCKSTLQVGTPGSLADYSQQSRDADLAPGQQGHQLAPSMGPGVIGRRSMTDLGAIGDNLTTNLGREHFIAQHEALEHAYRNLPLPKDSERPKSYSPVCKFSYLELTQKKLDRVNINFFWIQTLLVCFSLKTSLVFTITTEHSEK